MYPLPVKARYGGSSEVEEVGFPAHLISEQESKAGGKGVPPLKLVKDNRQSTHSPTIESEIAK